MKNSLESLVALHCAPALAGIKAANLVTWSHASGRSAAGSVDALRAELAPCGVSLDILCQCEKYSLLFIYREELLRRSIGPEAEKFLESYGYPAGASVAEKLAILKSHLDDTDKFPHEIGVFLDYPLEDVRGFIENRGDGCKLCGIWKVYGDSERALALFERYRRCTEYFCKKLEAGANMAQLLTAVPSFQ